VNFDLLKHLFEAGELVKCDIFDFNISSLCIWYMYLCIYTISNTTPESQRPKVHPKYIFGRFIAGISRDIKRSSSPWPHPEEL